MEKKEQEAMYAKLWEQDMLVFDLLSCRMYLYTYSLACFDYMYSISGSESMALLSMQNGYLLKFH